MASQSQIATFPRSYKRLSELDGLRGVAIGLVVITHCFNIEPVPGESKLLANAITLLIRAKSFAWSGVDLFFVLSGFLIGGRLLDTLDVPDYYAIFYNRRARRILPAYFLFLCLTLCCYVFIYPSHTAAMSFSLDHPALPWYVYLSFTANIWMVGYSTFGARPLSIVWSLAVEEQFYLVAPLLIRKMRAHRLPILLTAGIVGSFLWRCSLQLEHNHDVTAYVLLPSRINALLWGILGACSLRTPRIWNFLQRRRNCIWFVFYALGTGVCAASFIVNIHSAATETIGYDWLAVFYLTALFLVLIDGQSWLGRMSRCNWLVGLGTISYGLYLIHYTVYTLTMGYLLGHSGPVRSPGDLGAALVSILVAIGFATVSWYLFEKPILNGRPQSRAAYAPGKSLVGMSQDSDVVHEVPSGVELNALHQR